MKFGKLSNINNIDFSLPKDPTDNAVVLGNSPSNALKMYLGAPAWGVKDWVGKLYPPKTPQKRFLHEYSKQFNSIELNSTHYRMPTKELVLKWKSEVPKGFTFCPKVVNSISHYGKLTNKALIDQFGEAISHFNENLGITFLQLSERFTSSRVEEILHFIDLWPNEFKLAVEFRHESWFKPELNTVFDTLVNKKVTSIISDTAGRRDVAHMRLTSNKTIIRFVGNELHETDFERIDIWINRIRTWKEQGLSEIYFFFHEPEEKTVPEIAQYFIEKCNKELHIHLQSLQFHNQEDQVSMF